jgi:hypothetical protein
MADNYYKRKQRSEDQAGQPRINILEGMRDKTGRGRNDGLDDIVSSSRDSNDPDFGVGYEVIDPAPTRGLDKRGARAQKMGYNRKVKYLVIIMRDGSKIGYPGIDEDTWNALNGYSSTSDFLTMEPGMIGAAWVNLRGGMPPQSNSQSFGQGTVD